MEGYNLFPEVLEVNIQLTEEIKSDPVYQRYLQWLTDNGCIFPNIDFPVAFGDYGYIGAKAKTDIPSLKAFLFIPFNIIITPQKARESPIGFVFNECDFLFKSGHRSDDFILWVYLMYEFFLGEESFYYPYFQTIQNPEMLMDWNFEELKLLQDKFLLLNARKSYRETMIYFNSLSQIFEKHPDFFPPEKDLKSAFFWAYKIVTTRAFCWGDGMIIPLADNLNHEDVYIDYLTLSKEFLTVKAEQPVLLKDYSDFLGSSKQSAVPMRSRSHLNKLEKHIRWYQDEGFTNHSSVWELEESFHSLESSSDEEERVNGSSGEETDSEASSSESSSNSENSEEDLSYRLDVTNKYFVMRAGEDGSFKEGSQVFNCYGRLNNVDLLLDYGFCLLPNRYDSVYVRMYKARVKSEGGRVEISKPDIKTENSLKDAINIFYLKYNKLNEKFLNYFRKLVWNTREYENLRVAAHVEANIIQGACDVIKELIRTHPTTLGEDEDAIRNPQPMRTLFALRYRISQKRILHKQVELLENLKIIVEEIEAGSSVESAHWKEMNIENARRVYPFRGYLKKLKNLDVWDMD
ncbi:unnamed protein product [Blepharisma stoltei]|uniref:Rubisco LSMT substrate-binding domain-containing protein n=1 Tax=Blepharisma stoltei TaxID=1481888 RepID=A0AAU9J1P4_9CILI|nr:unnamed protein product [Blepharisma stoltei]